MVTLVSALSAALLGDAFASHAKVINSTDNTIYVFLRGQGMKKPSHTEAVPARATVDLTINDEHIGSQKVFEAIASTERTGDPDLKPLAGTCSQLSKDTDYTLLIESTKMGLKTSCTAIPQD